MVRASGKSGLKDIVDFLWGVIVFKLRYLPKAPSTKKFPAGNLKSVVLSPLQDFMEVNCAGRM